MKVLRIKTPSGFKMLQKEFEINFLTKTRVDSGSPNEELIELESGFHYPLETVFIGKNSSGKSTALELIMIVFELLNEGRIDKEHFEYGESFIVEIVFYANGVIYKYNGEFINNTLTDKKYLNIVSESLTKTTFKESYRKDLSNASYFKIPDFVANVGSDTSSVKKYSNDGSFNHSLDFVGDTAYNYFLFYKWLGKSVFDALIHLFDDSVEYIVPNTVDANLKNTYKFKRVNNKEIIVDVLSLEKMLSKGTLRGINLYALSIITFRNGGHLIVDEIEGSFNKNLVENLLVMYNDKTINKKGGSIIYSTHYSELLDTSNRCDNVNVLHRDGTTIGLKNMCVDYNIRTEMLKSSQFNQNTFDTLINYNRLMDLKDAIRQG